MNLFANIDTDTMVVVTSLVGVIALLVYLIRRCYDNGHPPAPRRPKPRK